MPQDHVPRSLLPDAEGRYPYTAEDDAVWGLLYRRQMATLPRIMAPTYLDGVARLGLTDAAVPQVAEIDARLHALSGAGVEGVPAIIPPSRFFALLAARKFPVATFLRRREEIDYIEEPDLFHEVFGHCPLLTDPAYADVIEGFGRAGQTLDKAARWHLFRLFWFTVEFGMIRTEAGLRAYGAGIASSPAEAAHVMSGDARLQDFDMLTVLRTPYRIDIVQPLYFVIDDFAQLAGLLDADLGGMIETARAMGDLPPLFEGKAAV